jgi:hypothetical protein
LFRLSAGRERRGEDMGDTVLKIKYQCLHPSCQVFCSRGELTLEKSHLDELSKAFDEEKKFKSPRDICRLGFSQPFKALSIVEESAVAAGASGEDRGDKAAADPLGVLKEEHRGVLYITLHKKGRGGLIPPSTEKGTQGTWFHPDIP